MVRSKFSKIVCGTPKLLLILLFLFGFAGLKNKDYVNILKTGQEGNFLKDLVVLSLILKKRTPKYNTSLTTV